MPRKRMSEEEIKQKLKESFDEVDGDKDGFINAAELAQAVEKAGLKPKAEDLEELVKACEPDAEGKIGFEGFATAIVETYVKYRIERELRKAFMEMDVDGTGFITADNVKEVCAYYGDEITEAQVNELIAACDKTGDGKVSLPEYMEAAMKVIEEKLKEKYGQK